MAERSTQLIQNPAMVRDLYIRFHPTSYFTTIRVVYSCMCVRVSTEDTKMMKQRTPFMSNGMVHLKVL